MFDNSQFHTYMLFDVSRYAIWYLLKGVPFLASVTAYTTKVNEAVFNITCAVSLIMAFWDRQM